MKKILILITAIVIVYFTLFSKGPLESEAVFGGDIYAHVKKMKGGVVMNHYYTQFDESVPYASNLIHILEFDDRMSKKHWKNSLSSIFNQYGLKTVGDDDLEMAGTFIRSGQTMHSYAAPINLDGRDYLVFFITDNQSVVRKWEVINKLKEITFN